MAAVDPNGGTVVLANDSADIEGGMPKRLYLAALDSDVEPVGTGGVQETTGTLVAVARCIAANEVTAE